jgi:hypothetical protein
VATTIEEILGIDVGITPTIMGNFPMRGTEDSNGNFLVTRS